MYSPFRKVHDDKCYHLKLIFKKSLQLERMRFNSTQFQLFSIMQGRVLWVQAFLFL